MVHLGKQLIIANWKMNLVRREVDTLLAACLRLPSSNEVTTIICPPFTSLDVARSKLEGSAILLGGQDCHGEESGAFTGNISASMLKDVGCQVVLVGHSERRTHQHETNAEIAKKAQTAMANGLHVILCVGESAILREQGDYLEMVAQQLRESLPAKASRESLSVAYEPLWAIGTGNHAKETDIREMHEHLGNILSEAVSGEIPRLIYGGSVKANNALEILSLPVVDGVLVGGASLDAQAFGSIILAATQVTSTRAETARSAIKATV